MDIIIISLIILVPNYDYYIFIFRQEALGQSGRSYKHYIALVDVVYIHPEETLITQEYDSQSSNSCSLALKPFT